MFWLVLITTRTELLFESRYLFNIGVCIIRPSDRGICSQCSVCFPADRLLSDSWLIVSIEDNVHQNRDNIPSILPSSRKYMQHRMSLIIMWHFKEKFETVFTTIWTLVAHPKGGKWKKTFYVEKKIDKWLNVFLVVSYPHTTAQTTPQGTFSISNGEHQKKKLQKKNTTSIVSYRHWNRNVVR